MFVCKLCKPPGHHWMEKMSQLAKGGEPKAAIRLINKVWNIGNLNT